MEKRKFLSDLLFVQGVNILIKAFWILVIDREVQNRLPAEDYGRYFGLFSFTVLFIILLDLGINNMNTRAVAANSDHFRQNFRGLLILKALLSLVFAGVVLIVAFILGYGDEEMKLLIPLIVFQMLISLNQYLRSNVAGMQLFKLDGILAVADRFLVVMVCGSWILFDHWNHMLTIQNFILVQVAGAGLTAVIGGIVNLRLAQQLRFDFSVGNTLGMLKKSLPYALLAALMAFFTRIDAVMIQNMLGEVEADRYAMSYRLLDAGNMIAVLLAGMLLPIFATWIKDPKRIGETTGLSFQLLIVPAACLAIATTYYAADILRLMYPEKLGILSPESFVWLMWSFVCICVIYIYGTLLTAAEDLKFLNILAAFTALGNVVLNLVLIPLHGVVGAALATLITQSFFAFICFVRSRRYRTDLFDLRKLLWIAGFLFGYVLLFEWGQQFFERAFVHIAFGAVATVGFVVAMGLFSNDTLKRMSRRKTQEPSDI